jgi:hypothetical protein
MIPARFTQLAVLELEKLGIPEDGFYRGITTPSMLEKALAIAIEGARLKRNPEEVIDLDGATGTARDIIDEVGRLPVRVKLGEAYNLASGVPDLKAEDLPPSLAGAKPGEPAAEGGAPEGPKAPAAAP